MALFSCRRTYKTRHGRHLAEARQWRRHTRGRTWQLAGVRERGGQRVYVWVAPIRGSRRQVYFLALDLDASQAMLNMLTVGERQHDAAMTEALMADTDEPQEIPGQGIMMV